MNTASEKIFIGKPLQIFISYKQEDHKIAVPIKRVLEKYQISVFLAHQDLQPGLDWQEGIINNLKQTDILMPIITTRYYQSDWTEQETGFAFALDKVIIPLKIGESPKGFIGKFQALNILNHVDDRNGARYLNAESLGKEIINTIIIVEKEAEPPKLLDNIRHCIIRSYLFSHDFEDAQNKLSFLKQFDYFEPDEIHEIIRGSISNRQIHWEWASRNFLNSFIKKYDTYIDKIAKQEIIQLIKPDELPK